MGGRVIRRQIPSSLFLITVLTFFFSTPCWSNNSSVNFSSEKDEDSTFICYRRLKILGIVLTSIGIFEAGIGAMYYHDSKNPDCDYPAQEMGWAFMGVGATMIGTGSALFFTYRKKLQQYEKTMVDVAVSGGVTHNSCYLALKFTF